MHLVQTRFKTAGVHCRPHTLYNQNLSNFGTGRSSHFQHYVQIRILPSRIEEAKYVRYLSCKHIKSYPHCHTAGIVAARNGMPNPAWDCEPQFDSTDATQDEREVPQAEVHNAVTLSLDQSGSGQLYRQHHLIL
jgi:hypothetical protein